MITYKTRERLAGVTFVVSLMIGYIIQDANGLSRWWLAPSTCLSLVAMCYVFKYTIGPNSERHEMVRASSHSDLTYLKWLKELGVTFDNRIGAEALAVAINNGATTKNQLCINFLLRHGARVSNADSLRSLFFYLRCLYEQGDLTDEEFDRTTELVTDVLVFHDKDLRMMSLNQLDPESGIDKRILDRLTMQEDAFLEGH